MTMRPGGDEPLFSLVLATRGRVDEVARFLDSVARQELEPRLVEVIVVDQNPHDEVTRLLERFAGALDLVHVRPPGYGLSYARNLGLARARGRYLAFPDDDCEYYPDTLPRALAALESHPQPDVVLGRIFDRATGRDVIKRWPRRAARVDAYNLFRYHASIALFQRRTGDLFDEELGAGRHFGSNEDADYLYRLIRAGRQVVYDPTIEVWHGYPPRYAEPATAYSYGLGFGAFARKHLTPEIVGLYAAALAYHAGLAGAGALSLRPQVALAHWEALLGRIRGFLDYRPGR